MGVYEPLRKFLQAQAGDRVAVTFAEIEGILDRKLPERSKNQRAWWSNNPNNNVMTKEWLEAGFQTEAVDVAGERLVFRRVRPMEDKMQIQGFGEAPQAELAANRSAPKHPGFGFMKGLMTIEPGYDLTTPSSELWFEGEANDEDDRAR